MQYFYGHCLKLFSYCLVITLVVACTSGDGGDSQEDGDNPPVANAGLDQNVSANEVVTLTGSQSSDDNGISTYLWEQTDGTAVTLADPNSAVTSFTAPAVAENLVFRLTVTDSEGQSDNDSITISVAVVPPSNMAPSANAGSDQTVDASTQVTLDGTGSGDSDGSIASYSWMQLSGTAVTLSDASVASPIFTAPNQNGGLVFELTVTDNDGASDTDSVTIAVENGQNPQSGLDDRPDNMNCVAPASPGSAPGSLDLVDVFPNLNLSELQFPLGMKQLPGNNDYFFAINRDGHFFRFGNDSTATSLTEVLDISAQVDNLNSEGGLLGFAFHPQVASNGAVYLSYTSSTNCGSEGPDCSVISRFTLSNDFSTIDPTSERVLLQLNQLEGNHNGGDIHFGPDGHLYIGFGDGGANSDTAQDTEVLLGSMLRLDVDPTGDIAPYYSIPNDNPFAGSATDREEIYAWGLRNPFRWSFDMATGILWAADVGQSSREEVDHIINGGNYGWNQMEGEDCNIADCSQFEGPVHDYGRSVGSSITGGYVYRGSDIPNLDGVYIFGDYGSGRVWTLTPAGADYQRTEVATPSGSIVSFARDNMGEVYLLLAFPGNGRSILKFEESSSAPGSNIPDTLSATGCFDSNDPSQPDPGLIPFDVMSPLWSDGASKERWVAIPNGETVSVDAQGDFDFPEGTILAKHFMNMGTFIETRLFMHHQTGWAGYSYEWNDSQTDATLLQGAKDVDDVTPDGLDWHFPSGAECRQCHTPVKNFALGPEVLQLNHDFTYLQTGRTANQVFTLNSIGVFTSPPDPSLDNATLYALGDNNASLLDRVKSYLHSNCSNCHQPGGPGRGTMDLRFETSLANMEICDVTPSIDDFGISGARLIAPGSPNQSIILERMQRLNSDRMPPLASSVVDSDAVAVFTDWINDLSACP